MVRRLKYRQLMKISTSRRKQDLPKETIDRLIDLASNSTKRIELEDEIAKRAGLDEGYVAIDVPSVKLLLSEPRMSQVDIRIIGDDGKTRWFKDVSNCGGTKEKTSFSRSGVCHDITWL